MKVLNYKVLCFRRRWSVYAVLLLLACCFVQYKIPATFRSDSVASPTHGDNVANDYSRADFQPKSELESEDKKYKRHGVSRLSATDRDPLSNIGSNDYNSTTDDITSSFLATIDKKYMNSTTGHNQTCSTRAIIGNSCKVGSCLQLQLPTDLRTRVQQIMNPSHLQLNYKMRRLMKGMGDKVPGYYDLILVSAVSSSHFEEGQAMLHNIHTYLFPQLHNFTFIYYNLGLTEEQRQFLVKICMCYLIDFPFDLLPEFIKFLKCYAWKPLIVNAHISRSNLIFWIDASVRFKPDFFKFTELLNRARQRGMQVFLNQQNIAQATLPSMFHFFGDEACVYANSAAVIGTTVLFQNKLFVRRAIVEPWAACALSTRCMCPEGFNLHAIRISCFKNTRPNFYGACHRFDQSALGILIVKIYQGMMGNIVAPREDYLEINRRDKIQYHAVGNMTTVV